jgi:circadian clock protein KaiB
MTDQSLKLTLYVTGQSSTSTQAVGNLHRVCRERMGCDCQVTIIDVLEQPELAEENKIIATPTLVKSSPAPARRIIGDLSDLNEVALRLGLFEYPTRNLSQDGGGDE